MLCFTSKTGAIKQGIYHPLGVSSYHSKNISIDFVGGLPTTKKTCGYLFMEAERSRNMCVLMHTKNHWCVKINKKII